MLEATNVTQLENQDREKQVPDLSIVLVCWNNKAYLDPCLQSLYDGNLKYSFDVWVVDNGSTDGSQQMLQEKYPEVRIIQNSGNVGLGKASNQGIEASRGRYILLLNNDTIVNGPSFDAMVKFLDEHSRTGAVGGKLLNPDGTIQACYNNFPTLWEDFMLNSRLGELIRPGYPAVMSGDEIKSVDWLGSACLMVRRSALDEIGLLDESYFIYGDETDLQYRLKKAGWEIYYLPGSTTVHYGGRSMNRWSRRKMVLRGKLLFYQKHYGAVRTFLLRILFFVMSFFKLAIWAVASLLPSRRERAQKEIQSNREVMGLCVHLR
jgi:N-acetylglucosaminyl-diphospho-decaprenol L-rhamnosyltransferase